MLKYIHIWLTGFDGTCVLAVGVLLNTRYLYSQKYLILKYAQRRSGLGGLGVFPIDYGSFLATVTHFDSIFFLVTMRCKKSLSIIK